MQIDSRQYLGLYLLLSIVYVGGLFVPLMNNDSAHHASIALQMYLSGDYASLLTQGRPYMDKPHLLFWLAAGAYQLLGVSTLTFKLPSLLFSILGVYSTYRLGRLLYGAEAGRLAALILASALAFILANNDVRMDAVLTGAIIFATWQLAELVEYGRWRNLLLAALGLALGFATKGMIGAVMPGIAVFMHLAYRRDWRGLFDPKWLVLVCATFVFALPVLYAYHQQFGVDGVKFILWSQNFERLAGERFGSAGGSDPLFFFHTFLWAFLPWSLLGAAAVWARGSGLLAERLRPAQGREALTIGTIAVMFAIISSSGFKLPHYLNILLPFFSVLLAAWLAPRMGREAGRGAWVAQWVVFVLLALLAVAVNGWAFPIESWFVAVGAVVLAVVGILLAMSRRGTARLVIASVVAAVAFNFLLNFNFYPQLLRYQAGNNLAQAAARQGIDAKKVRFLAGYARANSFDFTAGHLTQPVELEQLKAELGAEAGTTLIYTSASGRAALETAGLKSDVLASNPDFRVTRLNVRFLDPARRPDVLDEHFLLRVQSGGRHE